MIDSPLPQGFEEISREEHARIFGRVTAVRLSIAPFVAAIAVLIAFFDLAPWRRLFLIGIAGSLLVVSIVETIRFRRHGLGRYSIALNLVVAVLGQLIIIGITGGLESPLLPLLVLMSMLVGMLAEMRGIRLGLVGLELVGIWFFAAAGTGTWIPAFNPDLFGGGSRAGHGDVLLWTTAMATTMIIGIAVLAGTAFRGVLHNILRRGLEAREESLAAHVERNRELMALGGEIAHELKNPLASVKGLAALLSRDVSDEKSRERLGVLRREVDRMHEILEEFLTFSRPLVPLSLKPVDLGHLIREVALLHEGMAHERGVAIEAGEGTAEVQCDARKIKQIVINLMQNGLEASPHGSCLEVEVEAKADSAEVRILDRGAGVDAALGERAFAPGVTTKAHGSGLGLTIARSLARQHGGELTLVGRDGGGCAAILRLPLAPPEGTTQEVTSGGIT